MIQMYIEITSYISIKYKIETIPHFCSPEPPRKLIFHPGRFRVRYLTAGGDNSTAGHKVAARVRWPKAGDSTSTLFFINILWITAGPRGGSGDRVISTKKKVMLTENIQQKNKHPNPTRSLPIGSPPQHKTSPSNDLCHSFLLPPSLPKAHVKHPISTPQTSPCPKPSMLPSPHPTRPPPPSPNRPPSPPLSPHLSSTNPTHAPLSPF